MSANETATVDIEDLRAMIAEEGELPVEEVTDDANLADDLDLDSLAAMEIAVLLEKKYRIKINDEEIKGLTTLASIHQLVAAKVGAA